MSEETAPTADGDSSVMILRRQFEATARVSGDKETDPIIWRGVASNESHVEKKIPWVVSDNRGVHFERANRRIKHDGISLKRMHDGGVGVPLLEQHKIAHSEVLGRVTRAVIVNGQLQVDMQLSRAKPRAREIDGMWQEGIGRGLSVGLIIKDFEESRDGEGNLEVDITDSELLEVSVVGIPADPHSTAVARRSAFPDRPLMKGNPQRYVNKDRETPVMTPPTTEQTTPTDPKHGDVTPAAYEPVVRAAVEKALEEKLAALKKEAKDEQAIRRANVDVMEARIAARYVDADLRKKLADARDEYLAGDTDNASDFYQKTESLLSEAAVRPVAEVEKQIAESLNTNDPKKAITAPKLMRSLLANDGFAREMTDEWTRDKRRPFLDKGGLGAQNEEKRAIAIPVGLCAKGMLSVYGDPSEELRLTRAAFTSTATDTGIAGVSGTPEQDLMFGVFRGDLYTGAFRERLVMMNLGVRVIATTDNLVIPTQVGHTAARYIGEAEPAPDSSFTATRVATAPHRMAAMTYLSKERIFGDRLDIERLAIDDLMLSISIEKERVMINGNPAANSDEPRGILNWSGTQSFPASGAGADGGVLDRDFFIDLRVKFQRGNLPVDPRILVSPETMGAARKRPWGIPNAPTDATLAPVMSAMAMQGRILDVPAEVSNLLPINGTKNNGTGLHTAIAGDFGAFIHTNYDMTRMVYDAVTHSERDLVRIVFNCYDDNVLYRPTFLGVTSDIIATAA